MINDYLHRKYSWLLNPKKRTNYLNLKNISANSLKNFLSDLIKIREVELFLAYKKKVGQIIGPVHLSVGQEACPVAISKNIIRGDVVFGNHRSHAHILALGTDLKKFIFEIRARKDGLSNGMGGSMHLRDVKNNFYGSTPIVSGTIPIAAGAALGIKFNKSKNISVAYLGDSATEEGVFNETLNFSKVLNLPILFIVENNLMASHLHISKRQPNPFTSRHAIMNNIPYACIDGNDVCEIYRVSKKLINFIRKEKKCAMLEVFTYRWLGHVDWREDVDVGVNRSKSDLISWKKTDPIKRLSRSLIKKKIINNNFEEDKKKLFVNSLDKIWNSSENAKSPDINFLKEFKW